MALLEWPVVIMRPIDSIDGYATLMVVIYFIQGYTALISAPFLIHIATRFKPALMWTCHLGRWWSLVFCDDSYSSCSQWHLFMKCCDGKSIKASVPSIQPFTFLFSFRENGILQLTCAKVRGGIGRKIMFLAKGFCSPNNVIAGWMMYYIIQNISAFFWDGRN